MFKKIMMICLIMAITLPVSACAKHTPQDDVTIPVSFSFDGLSLCDIAEHDAYSRSVENFNLPDERLPASYPIKEGRIAYLTFDDGPTGLTPDVLDVLKEYDVKATFFVNGRTGPYYETLYKRTVEEGHVLGNHTWSHSYKPLYSSLDTFMSEVKRLDDYVYALTGFKMNVFRFPGGSNMKKSYSNRDVVAALSENGYIFTDWNVSAQDSVQPRKTKQQIVSAVLSGAKNKDSAIVLMHDTVPNKTTLEALPEIIEGLIKMGYEFDVMSNKIQTSCFIKV